MRLLLTAIGCCMTLISVGQIARQSVRIQVSYEKGGQHLEQAVETIEAVNTIGSSSTVEYRAGRSITMLPGFTTSRGSVFAANIKPVTIGKEGDTKLQLTAYPNPFEYSTTIEYYLPADGKVSVWIIDAKGNITEKLTNSENQSAGQHRIEWKPKTIDPGVYIPIVEANQQKATGRLIKK